MRLKVNGIIIQDDGMRNSEMVCCEEGGDVEIDKVVNNYFIYRKNCFVFNTLDICMTILISTNFRVSFPFATSAYITWNKCNN